LQKIPFFSPGVLFLPEPKVNSVNYDSTPPKVKHDTGSCLRFYSATAQHIIEIMSIGALDLVALVLAAYMAFVVRVYTLPNFFDVFPDQFPVDFVIDAYWVGLVFIIAMAWQGLYRRRLHFWREFELIIKTCTAAFLVVLALLFWGKFSESVSRTFFTLIWLFALVLIPLLRYIGKNALARLGIWRQRVIVMGVGQTGGLIAKAIAREPFLGYEVAGILDDNPRKRDYILPGIFGSRVSVLGGFDDAERVMSETGARSIILAVPGLSGKKLVQLVNRLQNKSYSVLVIPDLFGIPVVGGEVDYFFDEQTLVLRVKNNLANVFNVFVKRVFDIFMGGLILLISAPILVLCALFIKLDSPGPAFFIDYRIGRLGRKFKCYKFRTMYENSDRILEEYLRKNFKARKEWDCYAKLRDYDPRVTRVGRFLRKASLDELPQILNVLKGEMSLVGPRPYLPREKEWLKDCADIILLTPPGITGLWQVSGRNEIDFDGRKRLESWYVRNWSLWLDISLLLRTVTAVLRQKGAY
jgi:undecaprenyl-phosphate galactose phosphotransferase